MNKGKYAGKKRLIIGLLVIVLLCIALVVGIIKSLGKISEEEPSIKTSENEMDIWKDNQTASEKETALPVDGDTMEDESIESLVTLPFYFEVTLQEPLVDGVFIVSWYNAVEPTYMYVGNKDRISVKENKEYSTPYQYVFFLGECSIGTYEIYGETAEALEDVRIDILERAEYEQEQDDFYVFPRG